ncbi:MAG: hypothetical protein WAN36_04280, partial [Calditrichia bacterium]
TTIEIKTDPVKSWEYFQQFSDSGKIDNLKLKVVLDTLNYPLTFLKSLSSLADTMQIAVDTLFVNGLDRPAEWRVLESANIFFFDWQLDIPDPEFFFDVLFRSDSPMNFFNYHNPVVDSLLERARYEISVSHRLENYAEIENIIFNDAPVRPLIYFEDELLAKDYLNGIKLSRMGISNIELKDIRVNSTLYSQEE